MLSDHHLHINRRAIIGVLRKRARFLSCIRIVLAELAETHKEVFRRPPEPRIKSLPSILRKLNDRGVKEKSFLNALNAVDDLAGVRITIATQDQYSEAEKIIKSRLSKVAKVRLKKSWRLSPVDYKTTLFPAEGYCADHFMISKKTDSNVKVELQVRTLAHDFWAVFSHFEAYKSRHPLEGVRREEVINYSRLLDAVDFFAVQIRHRKEEDANEFHRSRANSKDSSNILSVGTMRVILSKFLLKSRVGTAVSIDTRALCELLREIGSYNIHTNEEFENLLSSKMTISLVEDELSRLNKTKKAKYQPEYVDIVRFCAKLRNIFSDPISEGTTTMAMKKFARFLVEAWYDEKMLELYAAGERLEYDGE